MAYSLAASLPCLVPESGNWMLYHSVLKCLIRLVSASSQSMACWYSQNRKFFSRLFHITGLKLNWGGVWIVIVHDLKLNLQDEFAPMLGIAISLFLDQAIVVRGVLSGTLCQDLWMRRAVISVGLLTQMWVGRVIAVMTWKAIAFIVFKAVCCEPSRWSVSTDSPLPLGWGSVWWCLGQLERVIYWRTSIDEKSCLSLVSWLETLISLKVCRYFNMFALIMKQCL